MASRCSSLDCYKHTSKAIIAILCTWCMTDLQSGCNFLHDQNEQFCFNSESFHVNLTNQWHHGSRLSKLEFFVDSTSNFQNKSHITFFSKTSIFWWTILKFSTIFGQKRSNSQNGLQKCQNVAIDIVLILYWIETLHPKKKSSGVDNW
jgi:hypothetical protein